MIKNIIKFTYERKSRNTWQQTLTHDRSYWNTCCTKSTRLQGLFTTHFEHYKVEVTAECYRKSDEKLLKVRYYQKCKTLPLWHYQSHNRVQQSSDTVLLRSESPRGTCAKLRTVAASNNGDHPTRSPYYCLFAPHICGVVLRAHPVRGEWHKQRNANGKVATVRAQQIPMATKRFTDWNICTKSTDCKG